jgi:hypothetical protein
MELTRVHFGRGALEIVSSSHQNTGCSTEPLFEIISLYLFEVIAPLVPDPTRMRNTGLNHTNPPGVCHGCSKIAMG